MSGKELLYLDWAATSPPETKILQECLELSCESFGNPSSAHDKGKQARSLLEDARSSLANFLEHSNGPGSKPPVKKDRGKIVFTGSGTEADQIPLLSVLRSALSKPGGVKNCHIVVSAIEHPAVFAQATLLEKLGVRLTVVNPGPDGRVSPEKIREALCPHTRLVAVMAVNNETGAVQNTEEIGKAVQEAGAGAGSREIIFHVDAVQALGKVPFSPDSAFVSSAAFSAHKVGGPRGVGALWISKEMEALGVGGGQEGGLRSGTENLFGALAFSRCAAKAAENLDERLAHARRLETSLIEGIRLIPGARILPECRMPGDGAFSPWIVNATFPGLGGEVFARALSDEGIAVSTGSACSHLERRRSHRVLDAMAIPPELAFSSIRISFGNTSRTRDIERFLSVTADLYRRLKT